MLGQGWFWLGSSCRHARAAQMTLARTTVIPRRNPSALVTGGLFAWSRNPIYLADAIILTGAILWLDAVLALPLVAVLRLADPDPLHPRRGSPPDRWPSGRSSTFGPRAPGAGSVANDAASWSATSRV
jgi:hypothetical protein